MGKSVSGAGVGDDIAPLSAMGGNFLKVCVEPELRTLHQPGTYVEYNRRVFLLGEG